jgi:hypothetical protein
MNRTRRLGRAGGLAVVAVAATPFAYLWILQVRNAKEPPTAQVRLDIASWMAVFGTPAMLAAWLLWRAWWRRAGVGLASLDGPAWLLAAATATLPAARRDWAAAMAAELAQVRDPAARWRFAAGCARAAVFPPGGSRAPAGVAVVLAVVAIAAAALGTGAALPAGRVFALAFVGLLGGLATLTVARSGRVGGAGPGPAIAGLAMAGTAACLAFTVYYLAEHPTYGRLDLPVAMSLPPVTAVVLAVALAGCVWLALRPPRWLVPEGYARWFGIAMAVALVVGFLLDSRLVQPGLQRGSHGMMDYLLFAPPAVLVAGSAAAAAVGRSFRAGLWACAWAVVLAVPLLIAAWLAEALHWDQVGRGLVLDGAGPLGVGANLGDAVWWPLIALVLWTLPLGVLGAAAGSWRARRRRARQHATSTSAA